MCRSTLAWLGLAALLPGCASADFFSLAFLEAGTAGRDRVVVGSLESVSESTQGALRQLGLNAVATPEGEAIRIRSVARNGERFSLLLTRERAAGQERTHVRLVWDGKGDQEAGAQILTEVTAQAKR